jgi:hypothetical protein
VIRRGVAQETNRAAKQSDVQLGEPGQGKADRGHGHGPVGGSTVLSVFSVSDWWERVPGRRCCD